MSDIAIHLKNAAGFGRKIEKAWLFVVAIFIGLAIFVPLIIGTIWLGVQPDLVLNYTAASVDAVVGAYRAAIGG